MKRIKTAMRTLAREGPGALVSRTGEFITSHAKHSACCRPLYAGLAQREWRKIEADLQSRYSGEDYRRKWGEARFDLYGKYGPIPCPRSECDRLDSLRDKYKGERIFIIGNGPSLKRTALEKLEGEYTFGLNRIYLLFDQLTWRPTFYTVYDWAVGPDNAEEVNALEDMIFFFPQRFEGLLRTGEDVYWYWMGNRIPRPGALPFAYEPSRGLYHGMTVAITAIQIAYHLGFDPIYVIGTDVDYKVPDTVKQFGPEHGEGQRLFLESTEDDPNHFVPNYFGKGRRWTQPDPAGMMAAFDLAGQAVRARGRRIYNATVGGKLEVYERVDFDSLF